MVSSSGPAMTTSPGSTGLRRRHTYWLPATRPWAPEGIVSAKVLGVDGPPRWRGRQMCARWPDGQLKHGRSAAPPVHVARRVRVVCVVGRRSALDRTPGLTPCEPCGSAASAALRSCKSSTSPSRGRSRAEGPRGVDSRRELRRHPPPAVGHLTSALAHRGSHRRGAAAPEHRAPG